MARLPTLFLVPGCLVVDVDARLAEIARGLRLPSELRTAEQMEWIHDRYKIDGLARLARSTPDYYEQKGSYLPDVSALAHAALMEVARLLAVLKEQAGRIERLQREVANAAVDAWQSRAEALEAEVTQLRAERDDLDRRGIALHAAYAREVRRVGEAEERAEAAERLARARGEALAAYRSALRCGERESEMLRAVGDAALASVVPPEQAT